VHFFVNIFLSFDYLFVLLATHEAVGTGDHDLLSLVIQHREYQHFTNKSGGMAEILEDLEKVYIYLLPK